MPFKLAADKSMKVMCFYNSLISFTYQDH